MNKLRSFAYLLIALGFGLQIPKKLEDYKKEKKFRKFAYTFIELNYSSRCNNFGNCIFYRRVTL